ncbi:MAG: RNA methyltransferase, partial [Actinomycetospora chiangmaiensis]|nr:RNA methyltransferase [Actinomycetospora chiangmaiensis]
SNATHVLDGAAIFPTVAEAVADLHYVLATTARERGQMKRVFGPDEGMAEAAGRLAAGERVGVLFGRERVGLSNDEVSLADAIVTFPVDPQHASLNLAQSVLLVGYEWRRAAGQAALPFAGAMRSGPAPREALISLFESLEADLDAAGYYPPPKRDGMIRNMRDMFHRMAMTEQDVRTFRGALRALARRPPEE